MGAAGSCLETVLSVLWDLGMIHGGTGLQGMTTPILLGLPCAAGTDQNVNLR